MGIESALYSDIYKVAGRCDLIADFRGVPSIIDYKTSDKVKREDWIENYFLQSSLYSYMLWEMTGVVTRQIVLLIAIEDSNMCQVIVKKPSQYITKAISLVKKYHEQASQQS
jgi:genome maintenance exonuclease 1